MACLKSQAERNYLRRLALTMTAYVLLVWGTSAAVRHWHLSRWELYACALLPALMVVKLLHVVALYLQEQKDEYLRRQLVQSILLGLAAVLAVNSFSDFLRSYAGVKGLPPFTLFSICWAVTGLAQGVQAHRNRVSDEEPTA